jgi:hypothetical protein
MCTHLQDPARKPDPCAYENVCSGQGELSVALAGTSNCIAMQAQQRLLTEGRVLTFRMTFQTFDIARDRACRLTNNNYISTVCLTQAKL